MQILHVVPTVDPKAGGVAESIRCRGIQLRAQGHKVHVVSLDSPNAPFLRQYPLVVSALGKGWTTWEYSRALANWLRSHVSTFDAVIIEGLWKYQTLAASREARAANVPYFIFPHGMLDPWFRQTFPLKHLKKLLMWAMVERSALARASAIMFTCEEEERLSRNTFPHFTGTRTVVAFGASRPEYDLETSRSKFLARYSFLENRSFLLYLGRLHPKKGCDVLIEAFAKSRAAHSPLNLVFAGTGDAAYAAKLAQLARNFGCGDCIHWVGMLTGHEKWGALQQAQAVIVPSHQENFCLAAVEALSSSRPVLITNKVNIWTEVEGFHAGLVDDDTVAGVGRLLSRWNAMTESDKAVLSANALKLFDLKFSAEVMAASLVENIERISKDIRS